MRRYYTQDFGAAVSHPDTREYSLFAQDAIRVTSHFALNIGVRYDLQTFRSDGLVSNPLWPDSGKVPSDTNNFAPRAGFAYSFGSTRPLVLRGGYGLFYTRIPSIYTSTIETENGIAQNHLFLDNSNFFDRAVFPVYPNALGNCSGSTCAPPANVANILTTQVSAFSPSFQTPFVQQLSLGLEREVTHRTAIGASYLYVHGEHLIRARDANLPAPVQLTYPLYDDSGTKFLDQFYTVDSFSNWQFTKSFTCPFPPCINPLARPIPQLDPINVFESAASSVYHGLTISAHRKTTRGIYFRLAYTWARAIDDGQDALVAGLPATVQNAYATQSERGPSVTDQRQRLVFSWMAAPRPFRHAERMLSTLFNDWEFAGVITTGTGRPVNARIVGDANRDGNTSNDRLPGARRNSFIGPGYATTDLRLTRQLYAGDRFKVELLRESFNLLNRANKRLDLGDDGFLNTAAQFVQVDKTIGVNRFPGHYRGNSVFLRPTNAYAPRQVQLALKLKF